MTTHLPPPPETGDHADDIDDEEDARLSWHDKEVLAVLRRLANARLQLQTLEAQLAAQGGIASPDPRDAGEVERLQTEIDGLARKAQGRFGRSSARQRVAELRDEQAVVLGRLGYDSYEAFTAAGGLLAPTEQIDPVFVEFARRELAAAEEAWDEVLRLAEAAVVLPDPGARTEPEEFDPFADPPDLPPAIDLTRPEAG